MGMGAANTSLELTRLSPVEIEVGLVFVVDFQAQLVLQNRLAAQLSR